MEKRDFGLKYTIRMFVERFFPLSFALFGTWLANRFLPPKPDLFVPGIMLSFFGGILLVISQKYMVILLCAGGEGEKFINGMKQSGALQSMVSYCASCERWLAGLIAVSLLLALDLFTWPPLRLIGAFFLFGSLSAFFRIRRLFHRCVGLILR